MIIKLPQKPNYYWRRIKAIISAHDRQIRFFLYGCLLFLLPLSSEADEARFADLLITNNAGQITVYAQVLNCFTPDMEAAILAGVPTTFTFLFDFYQERSYWWDKKIARRIIQHTIKYDNVKKDFLVSSTNRPEADTFQTFENAKKAMADLNGVVVYQVNALEQDKSYYLKMKAKLEQVRLPLHMEYVFFFVSLWDFETDWHRQNVTYQNLTTP
ncbi:MAG: DUF4390 domain-containing protein [Deltaproteobacteria bacterium]|nr:DUF4390 domain-containing protein [Deltaproteobacteria bacterium]